MRIVIASLQYHPDAPSGSARLAFDEATYLAGLGHEVWLVVRDGSGRQPEYEEKNGVRLLRYPPVALRGADPRRSSVHQDQTKRLLEKYLPEAPDCLHGHTLLQYAGALSLYGGQVRTCYSIHSPAQLELLAGGVGAGWGQKLRLYPRAAALHLLERHCLKRTVSITADSMFTRSLIRRLHGAGMAERVQVINGWADLAQFSVPAERGAIRSQLGWPADVPVLLTVRRLVPRMGLDRLIRALHGVQAAGRRFHLVVAGDGPLKGALQKLVSDLGLEGAVRFAGIVDEDTLSRMYGAADAFVLPTSSLECFGLIAVEALASGSPVLATPTGAIPEVLGGIEPQWLARDNSAEAIRDLVTQFLDGTLPRHPPDDLRAYVERRFSKTDRVADLAAAALGTRSNTS
jgi:glycosyltransferase involved in cell wall biosynthesis